MSLNKRKTQQDPELAPRRPSPRGELIRNGALDKSPIPSANMDHRSYLTHLKTPVSPCDSISQVPSRKPTRKQQAYPPPHRTGKLKQKLDQTARGITPQTPRKVAPLRNPRSGHPSERSTTRSWGSSRMSEQRGQEQVRVKSKKSRQ